MRTEKLTRLLPVEARLLFAMAKCRRAQSSLEYVMMLAAASVVIVLALAMIVKLKGAVVHSLNVNGTNTSITQAISNELGSLASNAV